MKTGPDNDLVELKNISKAFGGVPVLRSVNLSLRPGIVHGLIGGNGAGKSFTMPGVEGEFKVVPNRMQGGDIYEKSDLADARDNGIILFPERLIFTKENIDKYKF